VGDVGRTVGRFMCTMHSTITILCREEAYMDLRQSIKIFVSGSLSSGDF